MSEEKIDYGLQQFNAADLLKRNTVQQVFKTLDDACIKQEAISENNYDTSFTKRVDLVEGLLWKYTPPELKKTIIELHTELEKKLKDVDTKLSEKNKLLTQGKMAYEYSVEIFKLLEVILTNSPISIEYVEMEVSGDFKELITNIRHPEPVKLFATEVG
jgi:C4-dicarboxylate-specific signal transduction histidine kinase